MDSGCGTVDRAVATETEDPGFDSSHRQISIEHLPIECELHVVGIKSFK